MGQYFTRLSLRPTTYDRLSHRTDLESEPWSNKIHINFLLFQGNSSVYQGTYMDKQVAIKKEPILGSFVEDREILAQKKLNHRNVVKLLAVEHDQDYRYCSFIVIYYSN